MFNVHFNGDIVQSPDYKGIHLQAQQIRDTHRMCVYNYHENECPVWMAHIRSGRYSGRCCMSGSEDCPGCIRRKEIGNIKKTFKIDHSTYRKIASSSHYLLKVAPELAEKKFKAKVSKLKKTHRKDGKPTKAYEKALSRRKTKALFITLTFPKFRKKHSLTKSIFENEILNTYFSRFLENLRKNYHCTGYVAVREHGENNTYRTHYHLCVSIPFIDMRTLNDIWCNCISNICFPSRNALTSDPETRTITDVVGAVRYLCKYFSKSRGQQSDSRLVFISRNLIKDPEPFTENLENILYGYDSVTYYQTSEYTATFRVTDPKEFKHFCKTFLYDLFQLNDNSSGLTVRSP